MTTIRLHKLVLMADFLKVSEMIVQDFIEAYVKGTLGRKTVCGCWSVMNWGHMDVLQYTPSDLPDEYERVAYRLQDGSVLSNANRLNYVGRRFAWGHEISHWGTQAEEQRWLESAGAIPLPFTLFDEVPEMDVRDFAWVLKPTSEKVVVITPSTYLGSPPRKEVRHFSGACLFTIGNDEFLFDIDRQELQHGIFNPFLTKLPKRVETIQDAYDILMSDEIKEAITKKIEVKRQGEFFFVKYSDECPVKPDLTDEEKQILKFPPSRIGYGLDIGNMRVAFITDDRNPFDESEELDTPEKQEFQKHALKYAGVLEKYTSAISRSGFLGKSATGSHKVEKHVKIGDDVYVSGIVKQDRRQHSDLVLTGWYKVVANTGTLSWTITGDID